MPYTTNMDLENAAGGAAFFLQHTDWDADGVADATVIASAQIAADAFIDSYLSRRFRTPLAPAPPSIVAAAAAQTIYELKVRRGKVTKSDSDAYEARVEWLEAVAEGRVRPEEPLPPPSTAVRSQRSESMRAVAREKMKGFW